MLQGVRNFARPPKAAKIFAFFCANLTFKRNLKVDGFLLRGLAGVKAEASLFASCFNVARMISIAGVAGLTSKLGG